MSADPIGIEGGINLYCYCDNMPTVKVDYIGNSPEEDRRSFEQSRKSAQNDYATIYWHLKFVSDRFHGNSSYKRGFVKQVRENISESAYAILFIGGYNESGDWNEMRASYIKAVKMYEIWFSSLYGYDTSFLKNTAVGYDPAEKVAPSLDSSGRVTPGGTRAEVIESKEVQQAKYDIAVSENVPQGMLAAAGAAYGGKYRYELSTMGAAAGDIVTATLPAVTAALSNPNIRPHGEQPKPRPPGTQSHHPEQQAALRRCIANYDEDADPSLLMPTTQHRATFQHQTDQRFAGASFERNLGSSDALGQAAVIMGLVGVSPETAGQVTLEHSGYLFSLTPLDQVGRHLPASQ